MQKPDHQAHHQLAKAQRDEYGVTDIDGRPTVGWTDQLLRRLIEVYGEDYAKELLRCDKKHCERK